jgi:hypothetical protein
MKATITVQFENRVYGGMPKSKDLLTKFVEAKGEIPEESLAEKEEVLDLEESLEMARTGFRRNKDGCIFLRDFQILACMKQAVQTLGLFQKPRGLKGYMEAAVRIGPREVVLMNGDGNPVMEPTGMEEIQGRVMTPQGPRSILSEKEYVEDTWLTFTFATFVDNEKGKALGKNFEAILDLMGNIGLGSVRSRLEGRFTTEVVDLET